MNTSPAVKARLDWPSGVAVDPSGNLFIADFHNDRVRRISPDGIITTVISPIRPYGVAVDDSGNLFVADANAHTITKRSPNGVLSTVAGNGASGSSGDGGPATRARINGPFGVAVDASGALYIADVMNSDIRKVSSTGVITTLAGGESALHPPSPSAS